jgi:hypothetical protein
MRATEYRICEERPGYHIEFKNKLGFWCKYRRVPSWSPPPGAPFVVTFGSHKDAESVITALQDGEICNEGPSFVMVGVIITLVLTSVMLGVITAALQ